ncbi:GDP-L-galactose phosphorylase 1-like isoform X2 [Punica granatum]|uniref:GDP-L-galactose phosphorylase 1-like isoform X2 n=1 Tax=Punica granatum TaxID=22663 RepID=A0A6P8E7C7_PUNGR|nr:GDP-L-galactose phosphorylase 1-like isoform X2 [Punica granatum]
MRKKVSWIPYSLLRCRRILYHFIYCDKTSHSFCSLILFCSGKIVCGKVVSNMTSQHLKLGFYMKVIGDSLKFIAQLNQSWSKTHTPTLESKIGFCRKPSIADSVELYEELLFCMATHGKAKSKLIPSAFVPNDSVLVILNETPIDYGHVFLVPFRWNSHVKHLDATFLAMLVKMAVEINNHSFHLLHGSSSSISSQLYFEACYFSNPLAVELMPLETFFTDEQTGIRICAVLDYPIKTLLFESNHNFKALVDIVSRISSQLLELNITYNILVSDRGRKIYMLLQANFCSLSAWECGGYFLFNSQHEFDKATEDSIFDLLCGASLDTEGFEMVQQLCCNIVASFSI